MLILLGTYCKFVEYTLIFCIKMMLSFSEQSQFTVSQTGGPYSNLEQKYFRLISQKFYKKCFTKQMFRIKWKMSVLCLPFVPGFVVDSPSDNADLVVDLRVVVGLRVDATVVTFKLVRHLNSATWSRTIRVGERP